MSKHYEEIKTVKEPKNSNEELSWMSKLVELKVKGQKWKYFPPIVTNSYENFKHLDKLKNFKVYDDDIFLCGYMRSGNTMMQEMIWLIVNDFDFVKAKSVIRGKRFPYFDAYDITQKMRDGENYERMEDMARPRCFKSHFPIQCLPDDIWQRKPKIIHMSRNVKDVAVSTYYFLKDIGNLQGTLDEFLEDFLDDKVLFGPYREHYLNYINLPDYPNIMYLTYEWVTQNMDDTIHRVAKFVGKEISNENFELLKEHMKFDSMKKNAAANNDEYLKKMNIIAGGTGEIQGQIRKGKIGGHKSEMSDELIEIFDKWMEEGYKMNQGFLFKQNAT